MVICQSCLPAGVVGRLRSLAENEDEQRHEGQVDEVHTFDERDGQEEDRLQTTLSLRLASDALDVGRAREAVTDAGADGATREGKATADERAGRLDGRFHGGCCHCLSLV